MAKSTMQSLRNGRSEVDDDDERTDTVAPPLRARASREGRPVRVTKGRMVEMLVSTQRVLDRKRARARTAPAARLRSAEAHASES